MSRRPRKQQPENAPPEKPVVVGIGASAGGLAALRSFFSHVPAETGIAWVVVVHLNPEHESHLAELLQGSVGIPVLQLTRTAELEPDRVYVIPPGAHLSAVDSHLRLSVARSARARRGPIDHFFGTLARTHDGSSVGVILSGTGSDGAIGIKAIKEQGGFTLTQDPGEAEYDGMPRSAIATGAVDVVLPLAQLPDAIMSFARTRPQLVVPQDGESGDAKQRRLLQKVFAQVRAHTGRDFTRYKPSTILRRVQRRMQMRQVEQLEDYLELLRESPEEVRSLAEDLLINVTEFFRDPEVWRRLAREVIPAIFAAKGAQESVRVWSAGCATGEEVYSVAMLLMEEAARHDAPPHLQVFASDMHEGSLERAREGFYTGDIESLVTPERLRRFFQREEGGYRVRKELRELIVFAPHNLLADPPFSRLDLIICRNLLIYLQRDVQQELLEVFHYALRPSGYLMLGTSETVDSSDLFQADEKRDAIYRRRSTMPAEPRLPLFPVMPVRGAPARARPAPAESGGFHSLHLHLVEQYAPPSMLLAPDGRVMHLSRNAGRFLVHPEGEPTANAFKLVRDELRIELRATLHAARERHAPVRSGVIPVQVNGHVLHVVLDVRVSQDPQHDAFALVVFEEQPEPPAPAELTSDDARVQRLEGELDLARQRLQVVIEEYETSQEEMRASHEELQSSNEELRSTLEELETSKEELQSMNEELQTLNQENRHKVEELAQLSGDLQNLLASAEVATLFLDRSLRILRFTPQVSELFNVRPVDRGRPISDLTHRLGYHDLSADAHAVLQKLVPVEREVHDERGRAYLTRVLPYRSSVNRIEGVVVTFVEISERARAEAELRESRSRLVTALRMARMATWEWDSTTNAVAASETVNELFGLRPGQLLDSNDARIALMHAADAEEYRALTERALAGGTAWHAEYRVIRPADGAELWIEERATVQRDEANGSFRTVALLWDITERKRAERAVRASEERHRMIVEGARDYAILTLDANGVIDSWSPGAEAVFGWSAEDIIGHDAAVLFVPEDRAEGVPEAELVIARRDGSAPDRRWHLRRDGARVFIEGTTRVVTDGAGGVRGFLKIGQDVTQRRRIEDALRQSEERFRTVANLVPDLLWQSEADGAAWWHNARWFAYTGQSPQKAAGWGWLDAMHPEDRAHEQELWRRAARVAETFQREARVCGANGEYRWFLLRTAPLEDEGGSVVRWVGAATDIHDERMAREELEARVQERTAALADANRAMAQEVTERSRAEETTREVMRQLVTAEENERRRLSRELHDSMGQLVTGLLLGLRALQEQGDDARIRDLVQLADRIARDLQHLAVELRPPALDNLGLDHALRSHLEEWSGRHGIETDFHANGFDNGRLPAEVEANLYRIVQEALTNVLRHAQATQVNVVLERRRGQVSAIVEDNGRGFDVETVTRDVRRLGLRGMRERVALLGGSLDVESGSDGTTIFVRVPDPSAEVQS